MNSTTAPIESHTEAKSATDSSHDSQAAKASAKFRDDVQNGPRDTPKAHSTAPSFLHYMEIYDYSVGIVAVNDVKAGWNKAENDCSNLKAGVGAVEKIAPQMIKGAVQEVEQHPLQIASDALLGAGVAVGVAALAPEAAVVGLGMAAAGYLGYKIASKAGDWAQDARIDSNPTEFSKKDIDTANNDLQATGASTARALAAGIGGAGSFAYLGAAGAASTEALSYVTGEFSQAADSSLPGVVGYVSAGVEHAMNEPEKKPQH